MEYNSLRDSFGVISTHVEGMYAAAVALESPLVVCGHVFVGNNSNSNKVEIGLQSRCIAT